MKNIPPEIYYAIGKELPNKDRKKMRATCKFINHAVESLVFSSICMAYCFFGDMVHIRPGYLGYFDPFNGDIFRHVQKIKIIAVQQSTSPLSFPYFGPFIELDRAILKYFIPLLQNLRDISIVMEHKVPAWFFEALYPSLSSLPHIETIILRAKNEFYPPPCSLRPYVHAVVLTRTWDDAACVSTRSFLQTTPAVKTLRLENGDALVHLDSRRSVGDILGGFGDHHLGIENLDTSGFDLLEDWPSIKNHFRHLGSLVIHDNLDTPTGFWTCFMKEGAHRTIRQFSVKPDPRLTPHACLSPELWDFLWALEKLEFIQICVAFSNSAEEREMGESQGNEFYEKFLKKHGSTMKYLHLTAPMECSWSITSPGHLELLVAACPKLVGLTVFTSHVGGETDMIVPVLDQIPSLPYLKNLDLSGVIPSLYRTEQERFDINACYREKEEALKEVILGYKPMDPKVFEGLVINSEKSCVFEFLEGAQGFTCNFGIPHFVRTELHFG
ncbi:uncharacterized protein EV420DRAFT_203043 [Desarmillaria tabescens]|uniref:F-box domain-containing protein n=1 Tax=Armillaria tabescens TaxID=1929756 RepID=A0AA39MKJ2_ARMTA|nr:uncharacterized protein EV420DRAFT_203043 [Desarmillaria tabescens]KAK0437268.1 hypothetical protein EV420DRAFT_203043 [Desarmillaria tabescens]